MDELRALIGSLRSQLQKGQELVPVQREKLSAVEQALSAYIREAGEGGSEALVSAIEVAVKELGAHYPEICSLLEQIQEKL